MSEEVNQIAIEQESATLLGSPSISVDRALSHAFTGIAPKLEDITSFYDSLPHENKPSLSNLSLHFSATSLKSEDSKEGLLTYGSMLWRGTKALKTKTTPELPKTKNPTIVIYVGSSLLEYKAQEDKDFLVQDLSETVRHELTHYAQGPGNALDKEPRFKKIKHGIAGVALGALFDTRWAKTGTATFAVSEVFSHNSAATSLEVAIGVATLVHITGRRQRAKALDDIEHKHYLKSDDEKEARQYERSPTNIIELETPGIDAEVFKTMTIYEAKGMRATRWLARYQHKDLALSSPKIKE